MSFRGRGKNIAAREEKSSLLGAPNEELKGVKPRPDWTKFIGTEPEDTDPNGTCTPRQRQIAMAMAIPGATIQGVAREIGVSVTLVSQQLRRPKVQKLINQIRAAGNDAINVKRKDVIDGLKEAIDMAKIMSEPFAMIAGWREVAKIMGFYEPTKHRLEVSVQGQAVIHRLSTMSDAELLQLQAQPEILDADFKEITDGDPRPETEPE